MNRFNALTINNKYIKTIFVFAFILVAMLILRTPKAFAAYDGARLIDNQVFLNANSMNAAQIQQFLVDRGAGLASRNYVLTCGAPSDTATMNAYASVNAPCGQTVQASAIIYYAAQIYGVSPRVILATMQKEQSLTTAANPTDWQINQAMGYGCPDSGNCSGTSNFFHQIDNGTWALRYHYERANRNNTWWNNGGNVCGGATIYRSAGMYAGATVTFKDDNGVGYVTYTLANAATASFYCYTPHAYNNPQGLYGLPAMGSTGMYYSGSYNFVLWFERWFGTTQTPNHAWSIVYTATYTDSSKTIGAPTDTMVAGQKVYVVMQIRNQGNMSWDNTAGAIRLGASRPQGRLSGFCDAWIACSRPASAKETTIGPGQVATFEFNYTAPVVTGTFTENFTPLIEGSGWLADNGLFLRTNVVPKQYSWQFISQSAYKDSAHTQIADLTTMSPGEKTWLRLVVKNTSNVNWYNNSANGQVVNLGSAGPNDRRSALANSDWPDYARPSVLKESVVAPGQFGTFDFSFVAPNMSFTSLERFNLVAEGREWLPDNGIGYYTKLSNSYSWSFVAQYAHTDLNKTTPVNLTNLAPGQTVYIGFVARNTGPTTWYKSGRYAVYAATSDPTDRHSAFANASWLSATRPTQLLESSVLPGQLGTFELAYAAPATKGDYREYFRPVAENITHMNSTGMFFYTIVR